MYRYAEKAPGKTEMNPKTLSSGLSRMLDILYSKFCAATRGFKRFLPNGPFMATISPQAPPMLELRSKAFQRWYRESPPGRVPPSRRMQTLGWRMGPKAWKNQR